MAAIVEHVYFHGRDGNVGRLISEYTESGVLGRVQRENGCIRFEFYVAADRADEAILVEHWRSSAALDAHHETPMMDALMLLIKKYDISLDAEKFEV